MRKREASRADMAKAGEGTARESRRQRILDERNRRVRIPTLGAAIDESVGTAILMVVALVVIGVWVNLVGHSPIFLDSIIDSSYYDMGRNVYLLGRVCVALAMVALYRVLGRYLAEACALACCVLCVVTCLHGFGAHQTLIDSVPVELLCQFLMGMCYPLIVATFHITIATKLRIEAAVAVIAVAQAVEQVASNSLNALFTSGSAVILCIAFPLVACAAFLRVNRRPDAAHPERATGRIVGCAVALILASQMALAMASAVSTVGFWSNVRPDYYTEDSVQALAQTVIAAMLVLALSYLTLYRRMRAALSVRYQLPFLVVIAAFFCASVPSFFGESMVALDTVTLAIEFFAHVFAWTVIVSAIQRLDVPPLMLVGAANLFHAGIRFAAESLEGISAASASATIAIMCYGLIVVAALSAPVIGGAYGSGEVAPPAAEAGDMLGELQRRCEALGAHYGLTAREVDVFVLMAQGRTQTRIEEELTLSKSTVKTHIGNIFLKLGVHSKQELIDLVFRTPEDDTAAP